MGGGRVSAFILCEAVARFDSQIFSVRLATELRQLQFVIIWAGTPVAGVLNYLLIISPLLGGTEKKGRGGGGGGRESMARLLVMMLYTCSLSPSSLAAPRRRRAEGCGGGVVNQSTCTYAHGLGVRV